MPQDVMAHQPKDRPTGDSGCNPMDAARQHGILTAMETSDVMWSAVRDFPPGFDAVALRVQWSSIGVSGSTPCWQPSVNVYLVPGSCVVCVELAGVAPRSFQLRVEPDRLFIRGRRAASEPDGGVAKQVLAMEIDHGRFEREIRFPFAVDVSRVEARNDNGLVWVTLPLLADAGV